MASFEIINTQLVPGEVGESAEFSFLPNPPNDSPEPLDVIQSNGTFNMTNLQSAMASVSSDLSVEQVHQRLFQMLTENSELKETLKKNNIIMQEQMSTVSAWNNQVTKSRALQQMKLEEANKRIVQLENENMVLSSKVLNESVCIKCKAQDEVLASLEAEKTSLIVEKSELLTELKQQKCFHKQLENNIAKISSYLENLQKNSKLLEGEKRELTAINNELQVKLAEMNLSEPIMISDEEPGGYTIISHIKKPQDPDALKDALLKLHESEEELSQLKTKFEDQSLEIIHLKKQVLEQSENIELLEKEQLTRQQSVKEKFEVSQNELEMLSSLSGKYKDRCEHLQQQLDECLLKLEQNKTSNSCTINQLQEEIRILNGSLKSEIGRSEKLEKNLHVANQKVLESEVRSKQQNEANHFMQEVEAQKQSQQFDSITAKLIETEQKLEAQDEVIKSAVEEEAKKHIDQIDTLTAKLINTEQQLEAELIKVSEISTELNTLRTDSESIPILKAQIEVYKIDFDNEKVAKEKALEEIEKLQREIRNGQGACSNGVLKNGRRRSGGGAESEVSCPVCSFAFTDMKALANHVNRCIDQLPKD